MDKLYGVFLGFVKGKGFALLVIIAIAFYLVSMIIFPFIISGFDWRYVQSVWERWQALNVGLLAFFSSVIALVVSSFNQAEKRRREFVGAKAFLPNALSELCEYFELSALILSEAWVASEDHVVCERSFESPLPDIPIEFKSVFRECISLANNGVGEHLARILRELQVYDVRIRRLYMDAEANNCIKIYEGNLATYTYSLLKLQSLVDRVFEYARGEQDFDGGPLTRNEYINSMRVLNFPCREGSILMSLIDRL